MISVHMAPADSMEVNVHRINSSKFDTPRYKLVVIKLSCIHNTAKHMGNPNHYPTFPEDPFKKSIVLVQWCSLSTRLEYYGVNVLNCFMGLLWLSNRQQSLASNKVVLKSHSHKISRQNTLIVMLEVLASCSDTEVPPSLEMITVSF